MSRNRKKKKRLICGWCGTPIRPGDESDNLYEPDDAYADHLPAMAYVHKEHVRLEDHPLYDQMPHIVFTGLPDELEGGYEGF